MFTALVEMSTREIAENMKAKGLEENKVAGKEGGNISKKAKINLENKTNKKVVGRDNFLPSKKGKKLK